MTVPLTPPRTITADAIPAKWLHDVRRCVVEQGIELRPGLASIEGRAPRRSMAWLLLILPHNGWEFESAADRDKVLAMLEGREELPALEVKP